MPRTLWLRRISISGSLAGVALAALVLASLVTPVGVSAHAGYERSQPNQNELLAVSPERVDVWFTQEVFKQAGAYFVRVFDDQDEQVSDGDGVVDDDDRHHISADLPDELADGLYRVRWMTTSDEDGETDQGAFCFFVNAEPSLEQAADCDELIAVPPTLTPAAGDAIGAATPAPADGGSDSDDGGMSVGGFIAFVLIGITVTLAVLGAGAVYMRRRKG